MKKILTLFILLAILSTGLVSCSREVRVYEVGPCDCVKYGDHEYDLESIGRGLKEIFDLFAPKEKTFTVAGNNYTAKYEKTYSSGERVYQGEKVSFYITKRGLLTRFYLYTDKAEGDEITAEAAEVIAREHLSKYISLDGYTMEMNELNDTYNFTFTRCVGAIKTTESASVTLTKSGEVRSHDLNDIGVFKNFKGPSEKEMLEIDEKVLERLDKIVDGLDTKFIIEHDLSDATFIKLDGKWALKYDINSNMTDIPDDENRYEEHNEHTSFVVYW